MRKLNLPVIIITPAFCVISTILLFILPLQWSISWLISSAVHELGHTAAIWLCGVRVYSVKIDIGGAMIETEPMSTKTEMLTSAAGPLAGALILLFYRLWPVVAVCAMIQTVYNLLPVFPLDGGRILRCAALLLFPTQAEVVARIMERIVIACLFAASAICLVALELGPIPLLVVWRLYLDNKHIKFPCKRNEQIVQ